MGYLILCQFIATIGFVLALARRGFDSPGASVWLFTLTYTLIPIYLLLASEAILFHTILTIWVVGVIMLFHSTNEYLVQR